MDQRQMLRMPRVESQDVAIAESALQHQNAALQRQSAALLEDNEDLRASASWWKALYEEALRRYADLESSPKARVSSRVDARFPVPIFEQHTRPARAQHVRSSSSRAALL